MDEFLLVLPDTGYWEAVRIAERIRLKASAPVGVGGREPEAIETSLGVCTIPDVDMSLAEPPLAPSGSPPVVENPFVPRVG